MKIIYKYPLEVEDIQTLSLPYDHRILSVQNLNGDICLCAVVDTEEDLNIERKIRIFPTGVDSYDLEYYLGDDIEFLGTVQLGSLLFHVFVDL